MEALYRCVSGALAALLLFFAPIGPPAGCLLLFIAIDFCSGVAADRAMARRQGRAWFFESAEAWRTVTKAALAIITLVMAHLLERWVLVETSCAPTRLFAGFACGVELWSFLENAAQLSEAPLFRLLRRYARRRMKNERGKGGG